MMIKMIILREVFNNLVETTLAVDLENKNINYIMGDVVVKNEYCYVDTKILSNLLKEKVIYWDKSYIDNSKIDGVQSNLIIYTDSEEIKYDFKNKFPSNYDEVIKCLKEMVGLL